MGVIFGMECVQPGQKFYNQRNQTHCQAFTVYIHKSYANLKLQNGSLCNMISLTSYQTTERVSLEMRRFSVGH